MVVADWPGYADANATTWSQDHRKPRAARVRAAASESAERLSTGLGTLADRPRVLLLLGSLCVNIGPWPSPDTGTARA